MVKHLKRFGVFFSRINYANNNKFSTTLNHKQISTKNSRIFTNKIYIWTIGNDVLTKRKIQSNPIYFGLINRVKYAMLNYGRNYFKTADFLPSRSHYLSKAAKICLLFEIKLFPKMY